MEPHRHHIVLFVSRGFLISICDASRVYRFTQRPLRWRHFPYRMFNTPREYGNSDASLCCSSCVCACVRWLVFFCFQLFLIHLILCLFVKFFRELFFISRSVSISTTPQNSISTQISKLFVIRQMDVKPHWIAAVIRCSAHLLNYTNKKFEREFELWQAINFHYK